MYDIRHTGLILISERDVLTGVKVLALASLPHCLHVGDGVSMPTYLMRDSKRSVKPVVLDDGAASLRGADGAHVGHAQGVTGVVATEVLDKGNNVSLNSSRKKAEKTS